MRYWDTSALVPLLVAQSASAAVRGLYRADSTVAAWWGTRLECESALARLEREGTLALEAATAARRRLDRIASSWEEILPAEVLRETARRLLRTHDLRTADALQLAAAIAAAEQQPASLAFVCLDVRLARAAEREGFSVLPESP